MSVFIFSHRNNTHFFIIKCSNQLTCTSTNSKRLYTHRPLTNAPLIIRANARSELTSKELKAQTCNEEVNHCPGRSTGHPLRVKTEKIAGCKESGELIRGDMMIVAHCLPLSTSPPPSKLGANSLKAPSLSLLNSKFGRNELCIKCSCVKEEETAKVFEVQQNPSPPLLISCLFIILCTGLLIP